MYDDLNDRLSQCGRQLQRLHKVEAMLKELRGDLNNLTHKCETLRIVLEKENRDYEKLTEASVSSIFYSVLGRLEERAEKERMEAVNAELKYNQAVKELEDVKKQIEDLEYEKRKIGNIQEDYEKLYKQKLESMMRGQNPAAQGIMELNSRIEQTACNIREIDEALAVGDEVLYALDEAAKHLESAENWGMWDMFGGGFISSMVKHSHVDEAGNAVRNIQSLLRRFRTELADIDITEEIHIEIGSFAKFADFFFDGFISDWFVQSKIEDSLRSVNATGSKVAEVIGRLKEMREAEVRRQGDVKREMDEFVVG